MSKKSNKKHGACRSCVIKKRFFFSVYFYLFFVCAGWSVGVFVSIPGIVCDLVWGVWCLAGRGKGSRRYLHEFVIVLFYGGTYQSGPNMVCKNRGI